MDAQPADHVDGHRPGQLQALAPETFEGMESLSRLSLSLRHPPGYDPPHRNEQFATGAFAPAALPLRPGDKNSPGQPGTPADQEHARRNGRPHPAGRGPRPRNRPGRAAADKEPAEHQAHRAGTALSPPSSRRSTRASSSPCPTWKPWSCWGCASRQPEPGQLRGGMPRPEVDAPGRAGRERRGDIRREAEGRAHGAHRRGRTSGCLLRIGDNRIIEIP